MYRGQDRSQNAQRALHRRLYVLVVDALRSDYHHHPKAPAFGKLAMELAAVLNPEAQEDQSGKLGELKLERLDRKTKSLVQEWAETKGR
ncbi:hypothetical protein VTI74DRAFT_8110 [Chaetomium olivicolor]